MEDVGFLTEEDNGDVRIYDGAKITNNCSSVTDLRWSYTYGVFMAGCAYLYNFTGDDVWLTRTNEIVQASLSYFLPTRLCKKQLVNLKTNVITIKDLSVAYSHVVLV